MKAVPRRQRQSHNKLTKSGAKESTDIYVSTCTLLFDTEQQQACKNTNEAALSE